MSSKDKTKSNPPKSALEEDLDAQLRGAGIPFEREYYFHPKRRFRFDFAIPEHRIAVECEGGIFGLPVRCHSCGVVVKRKTNAGRYVVVRDAGRHNRPGGYQGDLDKYNDAVLLGWRLFRFDRDRIRTGIALATIQKAIQGSPLWQLSEK